MSTSRFDRISGRLALAVALLALVIAMGGTSYAAVKLTKNSVTSATIKDNSVTGADVKDRSLAAKDFKAGQLPAGTSGPQGAPGPQGKPGDRGPAGSVGAGAKLIDLSASASRTYTLADGVTFDWVCDPTRDHEFGTITVGKPDGNTLLSPREVPSVTLIVGNNLPTYTGVVRNTSTGAVGWLDVQINGEPAWMGGAGCKGTVVYMPLTLQP